MSALAMVACGAAAHRPAHANSERLTYAAYPVLDRARPSAIEVVSLAQAHTVVSSGARPIWVAAKPENPNAVLPEIGTARELQHHGSRRIWAAKSDRGGLCLLLFDPAFSPNPATDHTVTATCGVASELASGLALALHLEPSSRGEESFVIGLVPSGVARVSISLDDGAVRTAPVADNSYSMTVEKRITEVSFMRDGVRQHTNI